MKTWIIVRKSDLEVLGHYEAEVKDDTSNNRSHEQAAPLAVHIEMPEGLDANCLSASEEDDVISVDADADKVQARRDRKLDELRSMRDEKMKMVDVMVNELVVGDRADTQAVKDYRQALKDITDPYKKVDGHAKAMVDSVDWAEDVEWPDEP